MPCHDDNCEDLVDDGDCEDLVEFPFNYVVCDICNGMGHHVNPSIDAHGISAEEFAEDPDFAESYFSGFYDVECYNCGGKRVVPKINEGNFSEKQRKALDALEKRLQDNANYARVCAAERAMGC